MMTLSRRVAVKIAGVVVRYASSGCKEWAQGLAREVAFIQSDWAALWWAIGSTRVLLDRREATVSSLSEAAAKAWQFSESQKRNVVYWFMFLQALIYALRLLDVRSPQQRIGCWLVIFGASYLGIFLLMMRRRAGVPPDNYDDRDWTLYYKQELVRLDHLYHSIRFMVSGFALALYVAGALLTLHGGVVSRLVDAAFGVAAFVCIALLYFWKLRGIRHQITALDAVLGRETGGGVG